MSSPPPPPNGRRKNSALLAAIQEAEAEEQTKRGGRRAPSLLGDEVEEMCAPLQSQENAKGAFRPTGTNLKNAMREAEFRYAKDQKRIVQRAKWSWLEDVPAQAKSALKWTVGIGIVLFVVLAIDGGRREHAGLVPVGPLAQAEHRVVHSLDPLKKSLGFSAGGWTTAATDTARRTAAQNTLRQIQQQLSLQSNELPETIGLSNLEGLSLDADARTALLKEFTKHAIISYRKTGANTYILRARAADAVGTLYELTESGLRTVSAP